MTIAIGIMASNGLVIAADTQETMHGFWKLDHGKLSAMVAVSDAGTGAVGLRRRSCIISGAGSGHHIDALSNQLRDAFAKNPHWSGPQIKQEFDRILKQFHADYMTALAPDERPQLLIGCQLNSLTLLRSEENLLHEHRHSRRSELGRWSHSHFYLAFINCRSWMCEVQSYWRHLSCFT